MSLIVGYGALPWNRGTHQACPEPSVWTDWWKRRHRRYMAPEMIEGGGYGHSVDVWCYAFILYEVYEGRSPFHWMDDLPAAFQMVPPRSPAP